MRLLSACAVLEAAQAVAAYWMEDVKHQGISPFNPNKAYQVFRNVKDFGAVGDGFTDDTQAINLAITTGDRCGGNNDCAGTTTAPATIYFPAGTYVVSDAIIPYYYTQLIGDPTDLPVIEASRSFSPNATAVIDANPYMPSGGLRFGATNTFFRQIRNLVIDTTAVESHPATGLHWPSSQVTSLQNLMFRLASGAERGHVGILVEEGSGGFMGDLVFVGGKVCANFGNQQFTTRNLAFYGCDTAIKQLWDWGWTYKSLKVYGANVGINMTGGAVGSVSLFDSTFVAVKIAIATNRGADDAQQSTGPGTGALTMENVSFQNISVILEGPGGAALIPGVVDKTVQNTYIMGNVYHNSPDLDLDLAVAPVAAVAAGPDEHDTGRPQALVNADDGSYYERSKPQYETTPADLFLSARDAGCAGDGETDDTVALNALLARAAARFADGAVAYLDAGFYLVTDTVYVPPNVRITGEALAAIILASGPNFSDMAAPRAVVQVGKPGETGYVEWADTIVSGKGATAGAVFIEYNLDTPIPNPNAPAAGNQPSGLWDVHVRVGGFTGDDLGLDRCPTYPDEKDRVNQECICGYLSMHITETAHNVLLENNWFWVADHVIDDIDATRITIFAARGMHIASTKGRIWLYGTSVEHHVLYQYSLANTRDIFMGQIQTETPYHQPNPPAPLPFSARDASLHDPDFAALCPAALGVDVDVDVYLANATASAPPGEYDIECTMAFGLSIRGCQNIRIVGAGLYSFFNNLQTNCSSKDSGDWRCQERIFQIGPGDADASYAGAYEPPPAATGDVVVYGLNTVGTKNMVTQDGTDLADWRDNSAGFSAAIAQYRYA